MQELDLAVKPYVFAIAMDKAIELDQSAALLFQTWATKVGLLRSLLDRSAAQQAKSTLFHRFYADRRPFDDRFVQLASCEPRPLDNNSSWTTGNASAANVVTYSLGHLFFQVGLCDPDTGWRATTLAMLAAPRVAASGRIRPVRAGRTTAIGTPLGQAETYRFREIHALMGTGSFLGSPMSGSLG